MGNCGRLGLAALKARQYRDDTEALAPQLGEGLAFLLAMLDAAGPRSVQVAGSRGPPVVVYSDAFFDPL
eukprot:4977879-Alexandrium_andersonii.AAC.1